MRDKVLKMLKSGFNINTIAIANSITSAEVQAICHEANYGGSGLKAQKVPAGLDKDALVLKVVGFIPDIDQVALKVATKDTLQALVSCLHNYDSTHRAFIPKGTKSVQLGYITSILGDTVAGIGKCTKPVLEAICKHL